MCYACLSKEGTSSWAVFGHDRQPGSSLWDGDGRGAPLDAAQYRFALAAADMAAGASVWSTLGDWVEGAGNWIEDKVEAAKDYISANISGAPLAIFAGLAGIGSGVSVGNIRYYVPEGVDPDVLALFSGSQWANSSITYSFPDSRSDYEWVNPSAATGYRAANFDTQQAVRYAFEGYSPYSGGPKMGVTSVESFTNLNLSYAGRNGATIQVSGFNPGETINRSHGYYPGVPIYGGDVWLQSDSGLPGSYSNVLVLHELGHSLGLKHPHDASGRLPEMSDWNDSPEFTVMSYGTFFDDPQTFMQYDIAALQQMYGADFVTNSGNTVYRWSPTTGETFVNGIGQGRPYENYILMTLWDGGGTDTYDLSNYHHDATVDLRPGGFIKFSSDQLARKNSTVDARGNVYNAFQYKSDSRSLIENAVTGSGNDTVSGNKAANTLSAKGGNDKLYGHDGNDNLLGGTGADLLSGGTGLDYADYSEAGGAVFVSLAAPQANTGEAAGDSFASIEGLRGSRYNDTLVGDWQGNRLDGGSGNDSLNGREGGDRLDGGAGFDRADYFNSGQGLYVSLYSPQFNSGEAAGDTYTSIEGINGSRYSDTLVGDLGSNWLNGGSGNDTLEGLGGADTLEGGVGIDTADYFFASEFGTIGVCASLSQPHLNSGHAAGDVYIGIENLKGSRLGDMLAGNSGANMLDGGLGNDILGGREGNDVLWGGSGRDSFLFDTALNAWSNVDRIMDFSATEDVIHLSRSVFWAAGPTGILQSSAFRTGASAVTSQERIVYNASTGEVFFDLDGSGAAAQVKFATLAASTPLSANHFVLV